jgi:hypothetical protein
MKITLSPVRLDETLVAFRIGDVLTINGEALDFTLLPDGATLPAEAIASDWITGPVSRINGELHLTLRLPHGPNPSPAVAFPAALHVTEDGPIVLPFDPEPAPEPGPDDLDEAQALAYQQEMDESINGGAA